MRDGEAHRLPRTWHALSGGRIPPLFIVVGTGTLMQINARPTCCCLNEKAHEGKANARHRTPSSRTYARAAVLF